MNKNISNVLRGFVLILSASEFVAALSYNNDLAIAGWAVATFMTINSFE